MSDRPPNLDPRNLDATPDLGNIAEAFVAQWLIQHGWQILHRRWRCRWGEIDLVAHWGKLDSIAHWGKLDLVAHSGELDLVAHSGKLDLVAHSGELDSIAHSGELDLVALPLAPTAAQLLAFVEVKARRRGNWDEDGLLALTPQKQQKLWKTATLFLAEYPDLADLPCRFDVALVHSRVLPRAPQRIAQSMPQAEAPPLPKQTRRSPLQPIQITEPIQLRSAVAIAGYQLTLQRYIPDAFTGES